VSLNEAFTGVAPVSCRLELGPESALIALDVRTREVLAMVGSYEALPGGLDRATRTRRQPGSAFKPILYSYALHSRRFTPGSVLELPEKQSDVSRASRRKAAPCATSPCACGRAERQRCSRKRSFGSGRSERDQLGSRSRIESDLQPTASLALGAYEIVPLELVAACGTFASGGEYDSPKLVTRILGPDGRELSLPSRRTQAARDDSRGSLPHDQSAQSVIEIGTGKRAKALGRPLAGKTGTTIKPRMPGSSAIRRISLPWSGSVTTTHNRSAGANREE